MDRVCIGIPTNRGIRGKTVLSLLNLEIPCEKHIVVAEEGYTVAENRAYISAQAIKNECSHVLFVDDDMIFPPDTLIKLLADNKEIIGVNANSRALPLQTAVGLMDEKDEYMNPDKVPPWKLKVPEELFKCYSIGGGVLLIKTEVFKKIKKPWFNFKIHDNGMVLEGEDCWFCQRAKKAGYEIWCDPGISIKHIGEYLF